MIDSGSPIQIVFDRSVVVNWRSFSVAVAIFETNFPNLFYSREFHDRLFIFNVSAQLLNITLFVPAVPE